MILEYLHSSIRIRCTLHTSYHILRIRVHMRTAVAAAGGEEEDLEGKWDRCSCQPLCPMTSLVHAYTRQWPEYFLSDALMSHGVSLT